MFQHERVARIVRRCGEPVVRERETARRWTFAVSTDVRLESATAFLQQVSTGRIASSHSCTGGGILPIDSFSTLYYRYSKLRILAVRSPMNRMPLEIACAAANRSRSRCAGKRSTAACE